MNCQQIIVSCNSITHHLEVITATGIVEARLLITELLRRDWHFKKSRVTLSETLDAWSRHWLDCLNFIVLRFQQGAGVHVYARKAYVKSRCYAPLILQLRGGEWSTSRAGHFSPEGQNTIVHWMGVWVDVFVREKTLTLPEFEPQNFQAVVSRYTDWATAVPAQWCDNIEVEKSLREVVVEKFQALSWCLVAETEEIHENLNQECWCAGWAFNWPF